MNLSSPRWPPHRRFVVVLLSPRGRSWPGRKPQTMDASSQLPDYVKTSTTELFLECYKPFHRFYDGPCLYWLSNRVHPPFLKRWLRRNSWRDLQFDLHSWRDVSQDYLMNRSKIPQWSLPPSPCHLLNIHQLNHEWTATSPDGECNGSSFHLVVPMLESRVSKLLRPVVRRSLNSLHYLTGLKLLSLLYLSFS